MGDGVGGGVGGGVGDGVGGEMGDEAGDGAEGSGGDGEATVRRVLKARKSTGEGGRARVFFMPRFTLFSK